MDAAMILAALAALSQPSCSTVQRDVLSGLLVASAAAEGRPEAARGLGVALPSPASILGRIAALDAQCGRS